MRYLRPIMKLQSIYEQRHKEFAEQADLLRVKYNRYAIVRFVVFLIALIITILLWTVTWWYSIVFIAVFLLGFARFVRWHLRVKEQEEHNTHLSSINKRELDYLNYDFDQNNNGQGFIDGSHPYVVDLDIYGDHSFYQYANRADTAIGRQRFAHWLGSRASVDEISKRQLSVSELSENLEFRQHLQAYSIDADDQMDHLDTLKIWLDREPIITKSIWLRLMLWIAPLSAIASVVLYILYIPWSAALLFFIPVAITLKLTSSYVSETHQETSKSGEVLGLYAKLIRHIEGQIYSSEKLKELQSAFSISDIMASSALKRLSYIITQLNVRYNPYVFLFNFIGLWDLHWVLRLEKWKQQHKTQVLQWFDALAEFEAISSLATLKFNHPEWSFPEITSGDELIAQEIGHPLIDRNQLVPNDLSMPTKGHIKLITGSNMAGKSTFLRSIGINVILAMCGSVVCAKKLQLPSLQVYTSMRTTDALHESTSSFYAELKRLKVIIEAVESQSDVFFILDEILKGTNSHDRHTGSRALIQQMIDSKGAGLIATHDLELGDMEDKSNGTVENLRMEVKVESGKLVFDYKIEKGVSESFNATQLMREMGIKIRVGD